MMPYRILTSAACAAAFLFLSCTGAPNQLTLGSETTNGVSITIFTDSIKGKTSSGASVLLYEITKSPLRDGHCDSTVADNNGSFALNEIPSGEYNLFVLPQGDSLSVFLNNVQIGSNWRTGSDSAQFEKPAYIFGTVMSNDVPDTGATVFCHGSPFITQTDQNGEFSMRVPPGTYSISAFNSKSNYDSSNSHSVTVPGDGAVELEIKL